MLNQKIIKREILGCLINYICAKNINIYLTSSKVFKNTIEIENIKTPGIIIFGNEGKGLSEGLFNQFPSIRIPQNSSVESLNVGISACIIIYEMCKK